MSKWTFKGINKLEKQFSKKINDITNATTKGLHEAGEHLLELSQPLVPVDTGRLKASGKVVDIDNDVYVTYEAVNPENGYEYAPIQHEDLDFKHNVGQAKYLEEPFRNNIDELVDIVAGKTKEGVDK
mgnify:CR=1 FL=1|jgi:hypothetical protein